MEKSQGGGGWGVTSLDWIAVCILSRFSSVMSDFAISWTGGPQAPQFMQPSSQEY